ncbi:MAG: TetR/AcrR family transcriptional regulator [Bacteroidota bacterium]
MKGTKERILDASVSLFNQHGVVNVRLQHIADEAFLSIGNLAYHYKNKEAIVVAIHEDLQNDLKALMSELNIVPLFEYMDHYFHQLFLLQRHYGFFFTDMLEVFRNYPNIKEEHVQLIDWQKGQYRQMLTFNENRGVLRLSDWPEQLDFTIDQLWMQSYLYGNFQSIHDLPQTNKDYCNRIWGTIIPLLTPMGINELKQLGTGIVR